MSCVLAALHSRFHACRVRADKGFPLLQMMFSLSLLHMLVGTMAQVYYPRGDVQYGPDPSGVPADFMCTLSNAFAIAGSRFPELFNSIHC